MSCSFYQRSHGPLVWYRLAEKICKYPYVCQYICFQNAFVAFGLSCAPRAIKMDMEKKYGWQETILGEMSGQVSRTAASCGSPHACFMVECMNSQKDVCINMINQHMCIKKKAGQWIINQTLVEYQYKVHLFPTGC